MSEQQPKSRDSPQSENSLDRAGSAQRYPTEEELKRFEAHRTYQRDMMPFGVRAEIGDFAKDPENPTPQEVQTVETYNHDMGLDGDTFEEYFGYPDPREHPDRQSERPSSDDR